MGFLHFPNPSKVSTSQYTSDRHWRHNSVKMHRKFQNRKISIKNEMYYRRFVKVISLLHLALQFTNELLTLDASFFRRNINVYKHSLSPFALVLNRFMHHVGKAIEHSSQKGLDLNTTHLEGIPGNSPPATFLNEKYFDVYYQHLTSVLIYNHIIICYQRC